MNTRLLQRVLFPLHEVSRFDSDNLKDFNVAHSNEEDQRCSQGSDYYVLCKPLAKF